MPSKTEWKHKATINKMLSPRELAWLSTYSTDWLWTPCWTWKSGGTNKHWCKCSVISFLIQEMKRIMHSKHAKEKHFVAIVHFMAYWTWLLCYIRTKQEKIHNQWGYISVITTHSPNAKKIWMIKVLIGLPKDRLESRRTNPWYQKWEAFLSFFLFFCFWQITIRWNFAAYTKFLHFHMSQTTKLFYLYNHKTKMI